ncbi:MAG: cell envelope integrity protein TolA [Candidatus Electrothrix communis]|nr:MAG: cell envelope integrity protein TolA [Candidatus Electrothrix communis]
MSEYQYYEFQAIDKPLSQKDQQVLRDISSRAQITSTNFVNEYNYGNFKGNPLKLVEKYFDAFLYVSNWGIHQLLLRIPRKLIDLDLASKYCIGDSWTIYEKGDYLIFDFTSETEDYDWEEGEGYLSPLISLRSDLIQGDYRCLYLAWLFCAQMDELEDDEEEPPVPANLGNLNASLESFADFMRIDKDLIQVAAEKSIAEQKSIQNDQKLKIWVDELPKSEKDTIIFRLINDGDPHIGNELLQRFRKTQSIKAPKSKEKKSRTVMTLLQKAEAYTKEKDRQIAEQKAKEKARKVKEAAIAREKYLNGLAGRENEIWEKVNALILTRTPKSYDEAVDLLIDLKDFAKKNNATSLFKSKLMIIQEEHRRKPSFIRRLDSANL